MRRGALAAGALLALACAGSPPPGQLAECPVERELPMVPPVAAPSSHTPDPQKGAEWFEALCARCHSREVADRESRFFRAYPRLDCAPYQERVSDAYLHRAIALGGPAVGLEEIMKGISPGVPDEAIWDLIAYLRASAPSGAR